MPPINSGVPMTMSRTTCLLAAALFATASASAADRPRNPGPFDARAREIFARIIAIPTSLGQNKVPEMAEYLAGEFRAAGFPAEDVTVLPFKLPADNTASL